MSDIDEATIVRVPLGSRNWPGHHAIIDSADADEILKHRWSLLRTRTQPVRLYASRGERQPDGSVRTVFLHRVISQPSPDQVVDHANRNTLDNRRCNLRNTDRAGNARNCAKTRTGMAGYRGVFIVSPGSDKPFAARIRVRNSGQWIGRYASADEAAAAYNEAAKLHHGEFAVLNVIGEPAGPVRMPAPRPPPERPSVNPRPFDAIEGEEWKPVVVDGEETSYRVSNMGRMTREVQGWPRLVAVKTLPSGHQMVAFTVDGRSRRRYIYRLVMEAFVGPSEKWVTHINGDLNDNRLANLRYATPSEIFESRDNSRRLSTDEVREMLSLRGAGVPCDAIAKRFGVSNTAVRRRCEQAA